MHTDPHTANKETAPGFEPLGAVFCDVLLGILPVQD